MLLFIILDWSPNFSDKKCVWTNATFAAQTAILATEWHLSEMTARFSNFVGVLVTRHIGGRRTPGRPNTPRPTEKLQERVLTLYLFKDKCQSINKKKIPRHCLRFGRTVEEMQGRWNLRKPLYPADFCFAISSWIRHLNN